MKSLMDPQGLKAAMHALIGVLVLHVALAELLIAQSPPTVARDQPDKNQPKTLKLGKPIEKDLRGGETRSYRIHAKAGQYLHVVAEQEGIHVVVTLIDPHGKQLTQTDMLNGSYGPEPLSAIVADSGYFRLEVASNGKNPVAGHYKLQLTDLRPPRAEDRLRISAESTYMEGQRLWLRFDEESRKAAVVKWEESFHLWQTLDDKYEQGLSLHGIGRLYRALGDKEKALDSFNQALPLWRAAGDRDGEADTLNNIGCTYNGPGREQKALDYLNQALPLWRAAGDPDGEGWTLNNIGNIYSGLGDKQKALDYYHQALPLWRAAGDRDGEGWELRNIGRGGEAGTLNNIGNIYNALGDKQKALEHYEQAQMVWHAAGNRNAEAQALNAIGNLYKGLGEKQNALEYYDQALTLSRGAGDRAGELSELRRIGNFYIALGDKQKALDYFNQLLTLGRAANDLDGEAQALNSIGDIYNGSGEKELRQEYLIEALPLERASGDRNSEAQALRNIGGTHTGLQEKEKALNYYNQALEVWRAARDPSGEAGTLMLIGRVYYSLQDKQKALNYYNQALTLWRAAQNRNAEAQTLRAIGGVYSTIWEEQKALDSLNQALTLWRAGGSRTGEATALNAIGRVYAALREEPKALDYYNQALPLWRAVHDRDGEALTLNCMGAVYDALGEKQKALDYYNQALPLWRAAGDQSGEGLALCSIGSIYDVLGEKQKALDYYDQAYLCWRAVRDPDAEAWALNSVGRVYFDLGDRQRALDYYAKALPLCRAVQNPDAEAGTLNNIGEVYDALGEKQRALDNCIQALRLWRAAGNREGEGRALNSIGSVYYDLGEKQKALDYYTQALPLFRAVQNPLSESSTLLLLMEYWKGVGKPALAIFFGKQGIDRFQQVRRNIQGLEKEFQESFVKSKESYYRELAALLIEEGRLPEAQQVLDLLKLEEYSQFTQRRGDPGSVTQPLDRTAREEKAGKEYDKVADDIMANAAEWAQLDANSSRSPEEDKRYGELSKEIATARHRFRVFLDTLYDTFGKSDLANLSKTDVKRRSADLQTLVGEAGKGTVGLYTLVLEDKVDVIVITPAVRVAREVPITSRRDLRGKVNAFVVALAGQDSEQDIEAKGKELYDLLIKPIERDLQGAKARTLVWSLDDDLRYLPLAALYDGKQYLLERYRNVEITTVNVGDLKNPPQVNAWHGVAMGLSKDYGLGALQSVPKELDSVVRSDRAPGSHGPVPGTILLDDSFTEANMESALRQHPPLVHIASHYVLSAVGDDENSYLLLGGKERGGQAFHLTLAEMNEEPRMKFTGLELLTLSGCQTGMGTRSDGREIDSLGVALQSQGAKAVMATLWKVDDPSTALLMGRFYQLWVTTPGMTKAEALQQAQLAFLHRAGNSPGALPSGASQVIPAEYANPYYWAPFILIGNWK